MGAVTFDRLVLRGFGLYGKEVSFSFSSGANVLLGANESGKSTMAEGLCGVIFGLKSPSERYRHWGNSPSFEGELWLTSDGHTFHIKRWFDTDRVEVKQLNEEGKWPRVIAGEHKPEARKPNKPYLDFLQRHFGVVSHDTFRRTFFVAQPLPEVAKLDAKVQELLSGGGLGHQEAKKLLVEQLQALTTDWDSFVPGLGRGRKDRELETVQKERRVLDQLLKAQDKSTNALEQTEKRLAEATNEQSAVKKNLLANENLNILFHKWSVLQGRYATSRDKALRINEDVSRARSLSEAIATERGQLDSKELPPLRQAYERHHRTLGNKAQLEHLGSLGEQPADAVRSQRHFIKEQASLQAELRHALSKVQEDQRQAKFRENELSILRENFETKYGVPLLELAPDAPDLLSQRDALIAEKTKKETRLREAHRRPRRTMWPAVVGLLLGVLVWLALEGSIALFGAVSSFGIGVAIALWWRQEDPAVGMYQQELREVAISLWEQEEKEPLLGKIAPEALLLVRQELIAYHHLQKDIIDALYFAKERVALMECRYDEVLRKQEIIIRPRFFGEVCTLLGFSARGSDTLSRLSEIDDKVWADLESKAEEYAVVKEALQRIEREIVDIEREAAQSIKAKQDQLESTLAIYRVNDIMGLTLLQMDYSADMQLIRKEWHDLVLGNPRLPSLEQAGDSLALTQWQEELERDIEKARERLTGIETEIFELRNRQGYLSGQKTENLAQGEEKVAELLSQEERITREAGVVGMAITAMQSAAAEFHTAARGLMGDRATFHFTQMANKERQVVLDDDFLVSVIDEQGGTRAPEVLSQGARDQLYISLRLAIADLVGAEREIPLIFDDPFLTADSERQSNIRLALQRIGRQSLLLSHSDAFKEWGKVIRLAQSNGA